MGIPEENGFDAKRLEAVRQFKNVYSDTRFLWEKWNKKDSSPRDSGNNENVETLSTSGIQQELDRLQKNAPTRPPHEYLSKEGKQALEGLDSQTIEKYKKLSPDDKKKLKSEIGNLRAEIVSAYERDDYKYASECKHLIRKNESLLKLKYLSSEKTQLDAQITDLEDRVRRIGEIQNQISELQNQESTMPEGQKQVMDRVRKLAGRVMGDPSPQDLSKRAEKLALNFEKKITNRMQRREIVNDLLRENNSNTLQERSSLDDQAVNNDQSTNQRQQYLPRELVPSISPEDLKKEAERIRKLNTGFYYRTPVFNPLEVVSGQVILWAVDSEERLWIVPKQVGNNTISHAEMSLKKQVILAVGEARVYSSYGDYCLTDINTKSTCYHTNEDCLEIGKEAFKRENVTLLDDVLKSLQEEKTVRGRNSETHMEQTALRRETLKAQALWKKLKGNQGDTSIRYLGKTGNNARVQMIVDLAAALSSTTKNIKDEFHMSFVPVEDSDNVVYEDKRNRLHVPLNTEPLKAVLSVIKEMDGVKYEWAGIKDNNDEYTQNEKYAQNAATAIRLIEACHKLDEEMPLENLQSLDQKYKTAYANPEAGLQPQDAARQRIYDSYAQENGLESLGLPEVDTRNYELYRDKIPSFNEMRWKVWGTIAPQEVGLDVERIEEQNIEPAKPGDTHFDEIIQQGRLIYVISMGEEIIVAPRITTAGVELHHQGVARGKPILAAGEADIARYGDEYILLDINLGSGHYLPKHKLAYVIAQFHRHGIRLLPFRSDSPNSDMIGQGTPPPYPEL